MFKIIKHKALVNKANIIFFLKEKYTISVIIVEINLLACDVSAKIPAGNKIILAITAEIIAMETHFIQINNLLFALIF